MRRSQSRGTSPQAEATATAKALNREQACSGKGRRGPCSLGRGGGEVTEVGKAPSPWGPAGRGTERSFVLSAVRRYEEALAFRTPTSLLSRSRLHHAVPHLKGPRPPVPGTGGGRASGEAAACLCVDHARAGRRRRNSSKLLNFCNSFQS